MFHDYKQPWHTKGIKNWVDLIKGNGDISQASFQVLKRIWLNFPFELIIHWGENGAVTHFTEQYQVDRIAMELGCTRPLSTTV